MITDFYKLLFIVFLIIIIYKILKTFNSRDFFQVDLNKVSDVIFNLNKVGDNLEIKWDKKLNEFITKYVIVIYINNNGPYLKILSATSEERYFNYVLQKLESNIPYKIGIVAINDRGKMSNLKIKEFRTSMKDGDITKYSHKFNSNIICSSDGQHKIINKCPQNLKEPIVATNKLSNNEILYFNNFEHEELMNDLTKQTTLNFKI